MPVIYSSCANDMVFATYDKNPRVGTVTSQILIKGKANVQDTLTLQTARGAATLVSDDEVALLKENKSFMDAVKGGYFAIDEKATHGYDADEKGASLKKDGSAQDTAKTYEEMGKKAPTEEKAKK